MGAVEHPVFAVNRMKDRIFDGKQQEKKYRNIYKIFDMLVKPRLPSAIFGDVIRGGR